LAWCRAVEGLVKMDRKRLCHLFEIYKLPLGSLSTFKEMLKINVNPITAEIWRLRYDIKLINLGYMCGDITV
jgi:hypothetical protein